MIQNIKNASVEEKPLHKIQSSRQNSANDCCKNLCRVAGIVAIAAMAVFAIIAVCTTVPSMVAAFFISLLIVSIAGGAIKETHNYAIETIYSQNKAQPACCPAKRELACIN